MTFKEMENLIEIAKTASAEEVSTLEDKLLSAESKDKADYIREFARHVKGANFQRLEDAFLEELKKGNCAASVDSELLAYARQVKELTISKFVDAIIAFGDITRIRHFAIQTLKKLSKENLARLEDATIAYGHAYYVYMFAQAVYGSDIRKLESAILEMGDIAYIEKFKQLKGADVERIDNWFETKRMEETKQLEDKIKSEAALGNYAYIGVQENHLKEWIYNASLKDIIAFAKVTPGVNISKIEDAVIEMAYNRRSLELIYELAQNVPEVNIQKLENAIINMDFSKDRNFFDKINKKLIKIKHKVFGQTMENPNILKLDILYRFAVEIEGSNKSSIADEIMNIGDIEYVLLMLDEVSAEDKEKVNKWLLDHQDEACRQLPFYQLAKYAIVVSGVDMSKIEDAVIETGDASAIYNFINDCWLQYESNFSKIDFAKIRDAIIRTHDKEYIDKIMAWESKLKEAKNRRKSIRKTQGNIIHKISEKEFNEAVLPDHYIYEPNL